MKSLYKRFLVAALIVLAIFSNGCANHSYNFWKGENQMRRVIPQFVNGGTYDGKEGISVQGRVQLSEEYQERAEYLRGVMEDYFKETYQLDISEKLAKQTLRKFQAEGKNEGVMGFVDIENPNCLNLNEMLFTTYSNLFDNTYIHETLHQIGFKSKKPGVIDEGITDALTDNILKNANIRSIPTPSYGFSREIGYQILRVDKEIVSLYYNGDFQVENYITERLSDVKRTLLPDDNPGETLEFTLAGLTYGMEGMDEWYIAFQAQEITRAYCQTFEPTHEAIDYIRTHYIVAEYEKIVVTEKNGGFLFK